MRAVLTGQKAAESAAPWPRATPSRPLTMPCVIASPCGALRRRVPSWCPTPSSRTAASQVACRAVTRISSGRRRARLCFGPKSIGKGPDRSVSNRAYSIRTDQAAIRAVPGQNERGLKPLPNSSEAFQPSEVKSPVVFMMEPVRMTRTNSPAREISATRRLPSLSSSSRGGSWLLSQVRLSPGQ